MFTMPKQTISLSLSEDAVNFIDKCSVSFKNRSDFMEWLCGNKFFLSSKQIDKINSLFIEYDAKRRQLISEAANKITYGDITNE